jgi:exonuclease VII small subunit
MTSAAEPTGGSEAPEPAQGPRRGGTPADKGNPALDAAIADLERAAERLRAGDLDHEDAAKLVEDCAELAARVGGELDRAARAAAADPATSGQESLL